MAKTTQQSTESRTNNQVPDASWIDNVRVHPMDKGNLKAMVSVRLFEAIYLTGLRIVAKNDGGVFVAMPSRKTGTGFSDIYFMASKEWREALSAAVLEAYLKELPKPAAE